MIHLTDRRYWLYATVDLETDEFLHVGHYPTRNAGLTDRFLAELREKHDVDDTVFLVDSGQWLHGSLHRDGLDFRHETRGNRNAVERLFQGIERRTHQFGNRFRNAEPATDETWLQSLAYCWNQLI